MTAALTAEGLHTFYGKSHILQADAVQNVALAIKRMQPFGAQRGGHAA